MRTNTHLLQLRLDIFADCRISRGWIYSLNPLLPLPCPRLMVASPEIDASDFNPAIQTHPIPLNPQLVRMVHWL
jgi:hypothetical protein